MSVYQKIIFGINIFYFILDADQSRQSKRTTFPRQMSEDDESKVALICKNIPSNFNRGAILHKHFSRFGKIARIIPNPPKRSANVHFKDHVSCFFSFYFFFSTDYKFMLFLKQQILKISLKN